MTKGKVRPRLPDGKDQHRRSHSNERRVLVLNPPIVNRLRRRYIGCSLLPKAPSVLFSHEYLFQASGVDVKDEPPYNNFFPHPRVRFQFLELLAHVLFRRFESVETLR